MFCFKGFIHLEGKSPYFVSIPVLEISSQGKNAKNCLEMVKDLLEMMEGETKLEFELKWIDKSKGQFSVLTEDRRFIAQMLKRQRQSKGMTLKEVASKLGYKSHNSIAAYEEGAREPTLTKLQEILSAYGLALELGGFTAFQKAG